MAHRFDDPDRVADDCHMILAQTPDLASIVRQALIGPQSSWHGGARPARLVEPPAAGSAPDLRSDP